MGRFDFQGYSFSSAKEMERAKKEAESIEYTRTKIDFKNRDKLKRLYDSFIDKKTFVTPVGINFMKEIYDELSMYSVQPIQTVPVYVPLDKLQKGPGKLTQDFVDVVKKKNAEQEEQMQIKLRNLRIINVFLILLIVAMFLVVLFGKNSPLQDAEQRVLDKYASWEEQLKDREEAVTAKEQELTLPKK